MVRHYRVKIGGMPHARLAKEQYLEIFRRHILGQPPAHIAWEVELPGPTVRRALVRLRMAMLKSSAVSNYMRGMGQVVNSKELTFYEDMHSLFRNAYYPSGITDLENIDYCLRRCPFSMTPAKFKKKFLRSLAVTFGDYILVAARAENYDDFREYLVRTADCRFCKAKKGKVFSYRYELLAYPQIYLDYMHYLSSRRIGVLGRHEMFEMHVDATNVSFFGDVFIKCYMNEFTRSGSRESAESVLLDWFLETSAGLFKIIEDWRVE